MKNKTISSSSTNVIKSFQTGKKTRCLLACNLNFPCMLIIYNSNGLCTLCKIEALNELIDSAVGEETNVYQNQISNGLVNFWPINNDLQDYIGSSNITTGPLKANETIGFTEDRFNNSNGAIFTDPGYYILPPDVYFSNSFSFLIWVKIIAYSSWARIIDCGNGGPSDNIVIGFSQNLNHIPHAEIYNGTHTQIILSAVSQLLIDTWYHIAVVFDGQYLLIYVNGILEANATSYAPLSVIRTKCYLGRSDWVDPDSNACYDDIMIFNRALSPSEIQNYMNHNFNL